MILVTGASGFLGSAVVRRARERGLEVRAMVRESSSLALLEGVDPADIVRADLSDPASLERAVEGADAVIHCAAATSVGAPDEALSRRINVEGTRALLDACRAAGRPRFVNISSQSAHPENPSVYGRTKLAQDEAVRAAADIDWTILRPSIIYGPGAKGIFDKMVEHCRRLPAIPIIGSGRAELRPIHVDDVADAAIDCILHPSTAGKAYDLGGADTVIFDDFIAEILKALGRRVPRVHIPAAAAMGIARLLSAVLPNPPLTPDNVTGLTTVRHVDISKAQKDFGFAPRSFREGLREVLGGKPAPAPTANAGEPSASSSAPPTPVVIVGLGKMGPLHASMCSVTQGLEIAAIVDTQKQLGDMVRSMGLAAPFFASLREAIEALPELTNPERPGAALIATPQFTHRELGLEALDRGLHVFCEKPLAHTLDDARALARAAAERPDQVTAVGFMKGHYPLWLEAARRLSEGWIGTPRRFRATVYLSQVTGPRKGWTFTRERSGGGILINSGIHLVHFLHVLFGDIARATALARPMHSNVEDTLAALLEFRSGVFGSFDTSWSVPGYPTESTSVLVEADEGTLEITDDWLRFHHFHGSDNLPRGWSRVHRSEFDRAAFNLSPDYGGEGYCNQIEDFARAVAERRPARYPFAEGLRVQRTVDAIYRSADNGGNPTQPAPGLGSA